MDRKITARQLKKELRGEVDGLINEVVDAINQAQAGRIIAESEEPVRQAMPCSAGVFTRKPFNYGKSKRSRLFPPRHRQPGQAWENKGRRSIEYLTVNGPVEVTRTVYWNRQKGSVTPVDDWLGMSQGRYSVGVRELCCREAADSDFRTAADDLACVGQIDISPETVRRIVEGEGRPRRRPMHRGSDLPYKEFKIVAFYDPSKEHQYALGTSGNHRVLGRLMRQVAGKLHLDQADRVYSVSDAAPWILGQCRIQLPMAKPNILEYGHFRDNVIKASQGVYGQGTPPSQRWREQICGCVLEQGPAQVLIRVAALRKTLRSPAKRKALENLRKFIASRMEMMQYPEFLAAGYEIGSGPTEAFCKTLTSRLKGQGMRWDKPNAEAMMALASVRSSDLWKTHWDTRRRIPA